ncbi:GNAT family N-acetyltransferase [Pseudomonas bharatica]|uniref:GNAT family N-acetyltransferase n=1 Tax=Pseudomonas bharatica TaxID=2692112 RepID=UPI0002A3F880|nr:GNAT family N-acetyltransferase [Pseudomonas bharatica]
MSLEQNTEAIQVIQLLIALHPANRSVEQMRERVATTLQAFPYLVAVREGWVVGICLCQSAPAHAAYRRAVGMTVYVAECQRRSRVGQQLYDVLLTVLKRPGYHSAYADIALPNEGSVGL